MLIDLEQEAGGRSYSSEICVLGAGIAGLVLAHKLAGGGFKVDLLEAGGLDLEPRSQALYDAEMTGDRYTGAREGRFRVFGGSSTRWGGQLLPYTEDVFSPGAGMPSHAWPIGQNAIEPYYAEVMEIMGVDALPFTAGLLDALGHSPVPFSDRMRLRFSKWAPFGRRNLANTLGRDCIGHANVRVFTHANAMAVDLDNSGARVAAVTAKNYSGAGFTFAADQFCICLGTIESSRLLLASGGRDGRGVGNSCDQVGRYFHDHIGVRAASIDGAARVEALKRLGPFYVQRTLHTCKLEASAKLREQERLPAVMAHLVIEEPEDSGPAAVRALLQAVQRGAWKEAVRRNVAPMLRGVEDVVRLAWASVVHRRRAVGRRAGVYLHIDMEQVPSAEDRITLADTRDALGQRKAVVAWRITEQQRDAAKRYANLAREELEAVGIAPLAWTAALLEGEPMPLVDTFHAMGGLRMGDDARSSVVDRDLKVHGIDNLHVASCAVFPGGGSSNPTFTMMALTLRLADRLSARLRR